MTVTQLEPYVDWERLGEAAGGASKRWLEDRVKEGMPSYWRGNRRIFKASEAIRWLEKHGHIVSDVA